MAKFAPGQSGNPQGRPAGSLRQDLLSAAPEAIDRVKALASEGDLTALKLVLDRTIAPLKPVAAAVHFDYDETAPLADQCRQVMRAVSRGELGPDQGSTLISSIAALAKIVEIDELEARLSALEARTAA